MRGPVFRSGLVIVSALVVQMAFIADLRIGGAIGDVMILVAIAAAVEGGAERGAIVGFATGLVFDSVLQTPFGLSAMVYSLVAFLVGTFQRSVLRAAWWIPVMTAMAASAAGVILYVVLGQLLGQQFRSADLPMILFVTALINGFCSPVVLRLMHWALPADRSPSGLLAR